MKNGSEGKGFSYQILQTQGVSQSISIENGYLNYQWLNHLQESVANNVISYWLYLLMKNDNKLLEIDLLLDALLSPRQASVWLSHLKDYSRCLLTPKGKKLRSYHLNELKEIFIQMNEKTPMSIILAKPKGTLRFGHALRQLRKHNSTEMSEVKDDLDTVSNQDGLLRVLANAIQSCGMAKPNNDFIVIPDDNDLAALLDDIAQFGAKELAGLLIILSTLRYPARDNESNSTDGNTFQDLGDSNE